MALGCRELVNFLLSSLSQADRFPHTWSEGSLGRGSLSDPRFVLFCGSVMNAEEIGLDREAKAGLYAR